MRKICLIITLSVLGFSSCDSNKIFDASKDIENNQWNRHEKISYGIDIKDTITPMNLFINFRHADFFPYSDVYFFLKTTFPDGTILNDTIKHTLQEDGQWKGDGAGNIWDNVILFNTFQFPKKGNYAFEIEQASRDSILPGVMAVGLRIEKCEKVVK